MNNRWNALDLLKGIGVIAMILTHALVWWAIYPVRRITDSDTVLFDTLFVSGGLLVMFLPIAAGAAIRFSWKMHWNNTAGSFLPGQHPRFTTILSRSSVLLLIGIIVNVVTWGIESALYWNILHFISAAIIIMYVAARSYGLLGLHIVGIISFLSTFFYSLLGSIAPDNFIGTIFFGNIHTPHIWPLLPWIHILIFGFTVADIYIRYGNSFIFKYFPYIGTILLICSYILGIQKIQFLYSYETIWDYAIHPPTAFLVGAMGLFLIVVSIAEYSYNRLRYKLLSPLIAIGQAVTIIYVVHITTGFWMFSQLLRTQTDTTYFLIAVAFQLVLAILISDSYLRYRKNKMRH